MPALTIISFGHLHGAPPAATVTVDLREILRDPHFDPRLRDLTADDPEVWEAVWRTPGATELYSNLIAVAVTLLDLAARTGTQVSIAVGCAGGRHRAAAFAKRLYKALSAVYGDEVALLHRDLHRDVVHR